MKILPYDRTSALEYAKRWVFSRNPSYYDFSKIGGDCTNFVSQCLFNGCKVMNHTKNIGWYYVSPDNRAPAWTAVEPFYNFILNNKNKGPFGILTDFNGLEIGDFIILRRYDDVLYHNTVVTGFDGNIPLVSAHTFDVHQRPVVSYNAKAFLCIHVTGVRKI